MANVDGIASYLMHTSQHGVNLFWNGGMTAMEELTKTEGKIYTLFCHHDVRHWLDLRL